MPLERDIEARVREYCEQHDIVYYKFTSPNKRGVPDRVLVGPSGKVLFLELKRPGKRPDALQERELRKLRERGASAGWADNYEAAIGLVSSFVLR